MVKKGSFTVEASIVVPFLCFLFTVFLQMVLYLHDVSIFASVAYEAAQKGAALKNSSLNEKELYAKETAEELLKTCRLACSKYEVKAKGDRKEICVTIYGQVVFWNDMEVMIKKEAECVNAVDFLRNKKLLKNMGETET